MSLVLAVMHLYDFFSLLLPIPFCYTLLKSCIDKSTEWSTIPECPGLISSSSRGNTEGTNSSKILCLMFVYVSFVFM